MFFTKSKGLAANTTNGEKGEWNRLAERSPPRVEGRNRRDEMDGIERCA